MYVIRPIDVLNTSTYSAFLVHDCEVRDDRHRRRDHELCGAESPWGAVSSFTKQEISMDARCTFKLTPKFGARPA